MGSRALEEVMEMGIFVGSKLYLEVKMKPLRIMTVCGFGLGTSLVLRMTLDQVLGHHGIHAETFCTDADTALGHHFELVVTSRDIAEIFESVDVPVSSLMISRAAMRCQKKLSL